MQIKQNQAQSQSYYRQVHLQQVPPGMYPPSGTPRGRYIPQLHSQAGTHPRGRYTPWAVTPPRQVHTPGQVHIPWAGTHPGQVHALGRYTPRSSACWKIWATSRRYASHWNAFLFKIEFYTESTDFVEYYFLVIWERKWVKLVFWFYRFYNIRKNSNVSVGLVELVVASPWWEILGWTVEV